MRVRPIIVSKKVAFFKEGNKYASKETMSPESHERRMAGLRRTWEVIQRKRAGEKIVPVRAKTRKRERLRQTVAKEMYEIQNIARTHTSEAMRRLAQIVNNSDNESMVIAAASVIMDRAYGKASQTNINANVNADGKPSEITGKDLDKRIANALKRVEDLTGGAPKAPTSEKRPPDLRKLDRDPNGTTH